MSDEVHALRGLRVACLRPICCITDRGSRPPPQSQACSPCQGRSGWLSQTAAHAKGFKMSSTRTVGGTRVFAQIARDSQCLLLEIERTSEVAECFVT